MDRSGGRFGALLLATVLVAACAGGGGGGATQAPGATQPPGATSGAGPTQASASGGTGSSLLDHAMAAQEHFCAVLPTELVAGIIDVPGDPQEERFPPRCTVFGQKTAMAFWLDPYNPLGDPPTGATPISGVGSGAYLEKLSTTNWTLHVALTPDVGVLWVEVNNSDGKDHTDQAVALAKAVLAKLG